MIVEFIKFIIFSLGIVITSKYLLVPILQKISIHLELSAKASGNIAGIATSVPELLTVIFSVASGFLDTSIYNIISSNIINLLQYTFSIYINKNQKYLRNKGIIINLILCSITILIPIVIVMFKIELNLGMCAIFVILLILFYYIDHNVHKLYLEKEDAEIVAKNNIKDNSKNRLGKLIILLIELFFISIILYFFGELLGKALTNLADKFNLPQTLLGILLGFITSLPELITFTESQRKEKIKSDDETNKLGVVEATNNLLTSNIMNLFVIQTIGILIFEIIRR